jgi:hypothetical protein
MRTEKTIKPFIYIGESGVLVIDGKARLDAYSVSGVLTITIPGRPAHIVGPGEKVDDPAELEALGASRVAWLIDTYRAVPADSDQPYMREILGAVEGLTAEKRASIVAAFEETASRSAVLDATIAADIKNGFIDPVTGRLTLKGRSRQMSISAGQELSSIGPLP